ncbi:MAG: hypothetical protein ACR2RE_00585 [Geminicoccaceae bacterium]
MTTPALDIPVTMYGIWCHKVDGKPIGWMLDGDNAYRFWTEPVTAEAQLPMLFEAGIPCEVRSITVNVVSFGLLSTDVTPDAAAVAKLKAEGSEVGG